MIEYPDVKGLKEDGIYIYYSPFNFEKIKIDSSHPDFEKARINFEKFYNNTYSKFSEGHIELGEHIKNSLMELNNIQIHTPDENVLFFPVGDEIKSGLSLKYKNEVYRIFIQKVNV